MPEGLIRIGELSRRAGVPVATLKHYIREGLIQPVRKTGRTMSWYDPELVHRLHAIKELQRRQFLPLDLIRESIDRDADADDDLAAAEAISGVLARHGGRRSRTRAQVIAGGGNARELDWLASAGLAVPTGPAHTYRGDDLALLSTLGAARKAGISADMLPFDILGDYLAALRALVAVELRMFRHGVFPRARPGDVGKLTAAATQLSERLVVLLRRKLLLPTLKALIEEDVGEPSHPVDRGAGPGSRMRRVRKPSRRRQRRHGHGPVGRRERDAGPCG